MTGARRIMVLLSAALAVTGLMPVVRAGAAPSSSLDPSFGDGGVATVAKPPGSAGAKAVAVQSDGRILVGGGQASGLEPIVARLLTNGLPDTGFGSGGVSTLSLPPGAQGSVTDIAVQPDGRIVLSVEVYDSVEGRTRVDLVRLDGTGHLDPTFGTGGVSRGRNDINVWTHLAAVGLQPDGNILLTHARAVGEFHEDRHFDLTLYRFNADGSPDTGFGADGVAAIDFSTPGVLRDDFGTSVAVLADGRIVVGGGSVRADDGEGVGYEFALARLTPSGQLDPTFGAGGKVLSEFGTPDDDVSASFHSLVARPDGAIIAAGTRYVSTSFASGLLFARYTVDGALDPSFGSGGTAVISSPPTELTENFLTGLAIDAAGRVVAAGARRHQISGEHDIDFLAVRLLPSGAPDPSFGGSGLVISRLSRRMDVADNVAVQSDGKIVAVGTVNEAFHPDEFKPRFTAVRYAASTGVKSWGWNPVGELGTGTNIDAHAAAVAPALYGTAAVSSGAYYHGLAVKGDGNVWAWGWNGVGQLGDGTTSDRWSPVPVASLHGVSAVAAGQYHSLAVDGDGGHVWSWGWNALGQLGDASTTDRHTPVEVSGLQDVVGVAAGVHHSLAVKDDGTVWAWGWNGVGQLGDGTTTDRSSPTQVPGLTGVVAVSAGYYHSLALKADGTVWAWGWNVAGQLGDGTTADRWSPVHVSGLAAVGSISAGAYHSLAVKTDGTAWSWGWNAIGQLGDGTTVDRHGPVAVAGLTGVAEVSGGGLHNLAAMRDGTVRAWGWNGVGQLGTGATADSLVPTLVTGVAGATQVAAGMAQSFAVGP